MEGEGYDAWTHGEDIGMINVIDKDYDILKPRPLYESDPQWILRMRSKFGRYAHYAIGRMYDKERQRGKNHIYTYPTDMIRSRLLADAYTDIDKNYKLNHMKTIINGATT